MIIGLGGCLIFIGVLAIISAVDTLSKYPARDYLSGVYNDYAVEYHNAIIMRNVGIVLVVAGVILFAVGCLIVYFKDNAKKHSVVVKKAGEHGFVCLNCGAFVDNGHNFCKNCGNDIRIQSYHEKDIMPVCVNCGEPIEQGTNFCPHCGYIQSKN